MALPIGFGHLGHTGSTQNQREKRAKTELQIQLPTHSIANMQNTHHTSHAIHCIMYIHNMYKFCLHISFRDTIYDIIPLMHIDFIEHLRLELGRGRRCSRELEWESYGLLRMDCLASE